MVEKQFIAFPPIFLYHDAKLGTWRGARVVELATLERWYTGNGIVGSNPTLSASNDKADSFESAFVFLSLRIGSRRCV